MISHTVQPPVSPLHAAHIAPGAKLYADRRDMITAQTAEIVAEIGTYQGYFAAYMLEVLKPKALHLFDVDMAPLRATRPELVDDARVRLWEGDSADTLAQVPAETFDLIYIDGDHTYEGVRRDVVQAQRLVKVGGVVIFNDYTLWSILQMSRYGVVQNVNELVAGGRFLIEGFAFQPEGYHDIALRCVS